MAYANGTEGNSSTITFGTSGLSLNWRTITPPALTRESRDITHLGSSWEAAFPGEVLRLGEMTVTAIHDPDQNDALKTLIGAASETITITHPIPSGGASGQTFAFSGFVTNIEFGELANDETQEVTLTIKPTGEPTMTDSA